VSAYYHTPFGAKRPHAGGWFLKMLEPPDLQGLHVHFAAAEDPDSAEDEMIGCLCSQVSEQHLPSYRIGRTRFRSTNLEWPRRVRKAHGITGARGLLSPASASSIVHSSSRTRASGKELQVVPSVDGGIEEERPCQIQWDAQHDRCDGKAALPEQRGKNENERRNKSDDCHCELRGREVLASTRRGALVLACQPVGRASDQYRETCTAEKSERHEHG